MARSVKLIVMSSGMAALAHPGANPGFAGRNPVVEITDVPEDVSTEEVRITYSRCVITPLGHADKPVPWRTIRGAKQGQIVRLARGRPPKDEADRKRNKTLRLSPDVIALIEGSTVERVEDVLRAGLG